MSMSKGAISARFAILRDLEGQQFTALTLAVGEMKKRNLSLEEHSFRLAEQGGENLEVSRTLA